MRFIETHWGDTVGFDQFMAECARLARERGTRS
jgi:hypothetical protein